MRFTTEFRVEGFAGRGGGCDEEETSIDLADEVCGLAVDITKGSAEDERAAEATRQYEERLLRVCDNRKAHQDTYQPSLPFPRALEATRPP